MGRLLDKYGPWALVTGASSGIGAEFARRLAGHGLHVVLVARRQERLEALASELESEHRVETRVVVADLSSERFYEALEPRIRDLEIGLLVNNAGAGLAGALIENDLDKELALLHLNCRAPLVLTHHLSGPMVDRGRGGIVFVSSVVGWVPMPYLSNYSATKAYDLFLGSGLWYELRPHGIDVLTLCPGATRTEFGDAAGFGASGGMDVAPVVDEALRGLGRRPVVVAGMGNRALLGAARLVPTRLRLEILGRMGARMAP